MLKMRIMKKAIRFFLKSLVVLIVAGVLYSIHLQRLASHVPSGQQALKVRVERGQRNEPLPLSEEKPSLLRIPLLNQAPTYKSTFTERDMLDEHGNRFTIVIWINHPGKPGYLANPKECLGNISCQVVYASSIVKPVHAVVFKADHISFNFLPAER